MATHSRLSRETRLLLATAVLATAALWTLARLRWATDAPAQPVAPILAPFVAKPPFTELTEHVRAISARLQPSLSSTTVVGPGRDHRTTASKEVAVLRVRPDIGVALVEDGWTSPDVIERDRATGLATVRVAPGPSVPPAPLSGDDLELPMYVMRTETFDQRVMLVPRLFGGGVSRTSPLWAGTVVEIAGDVPGPASSLLFTTDGEWVGLVGALQDRTLLVPASLAGAMVDRLSTAPPAPHASLGFSIQEMSPSLARWSGVSGGVVVSSVTPDGPASGHLAVGDVLIGTASQELPTLEHWQRLLADLEPSPLTIRLQRDRTPQEVTLVPQVDLEVKASTVPSLGLSMRMVSGVGSLVMAVEHGSIGATGGLYAGDILTHVGSIDAPTPAIVRRLVREAEGRPVLVGFVRGSDHHVTTLER